MYQGRWWYKSQCKAWRRWNEMSQLMQWGKGKKGGNSSFFSFLFYSGSPLIGWYPHTLGRVIYWVIDSSASLLWRHPHWHIQKQCLIWAFLGQSSWHITDGQNEFVQHLGLHVSKVKKKMYIPFDPTIPQVRQRFSHSMCIAIGKQLEINSISTNRWLFEYMVTIYMTESLIPMKKQWCFWNVLLDLEWWSYIFGWKKHIKKCMCTINQL